MKACARASTMVKNKLQTVGRKRKTAAAKMLKAEKVALKGDNPLLEPWTTPFEMPPFDRVAHRALHAGVRPRLCRQPQGDRGDRRRRGGADLRQHHRCPGAGRPTPLDRVSSVFFNLAATDTNPDIQAIERALAPRFAKHGMRIYQDETLFARVDALFKKRKKLEAERGAGARARALSPRLRQVRRRARRQGQEAHGGDRRSACRCSAPTSARTCWPTSRRS